MRGRTNLFNPHDDVIHVTKSLKMNDPGDTGFPMRARRMTTNEKLEWIIENSVRSDFLEEEAEKDMKEAQRRQKGQRLSRLYGSAVGSKVVRTRAKMKNLSTLKEDDVMHRRKSRVSGTRRTTVKVADIDTTAGDDAISIASRTPSPKKAPRRTVSTPEMIERPQLRVNPNRGISRAGTTGELLRPASRELGSVAADASDGRSFIGGGPGDGDGDARSGVDGGDGRSVRGELRSVADAEVEAEEDDESAWGVTFAPGELQIPKRAAVSQAKAARQREKAVLDQRQPWYCGYANSYDLSPASPFAKVTRYGYNGSAALLRRSRKPGESPGVMLEDHIPAFLDDVEPVEEYVPRIQAINQTWGSPKSWPPNAAYPNGSPLLNPPLNSPAGTVVAATGVPLADSTYTYRSQTTAGDSEWGLSPTAAAQAAARASASGTRQPGRSGAATQQPRRAGASPQPGHAHSHSRAGQPLVQLNPNGRHRAGTQTSAAGGVAGGGSPGMTKSASTPLLNSGRSRTRTSSQGSSAGGRGGEQASVDEMDVPGSPARSRALSQRGRKDGYMCTRIHRAVQRDRTELQKLEAMARRKRHEDWQATLEAGASPFLIRYGSTGAPNRERRVRYMTDFTLVRPERDIGGTLIAVEREREQRTKRFLLKWREMGALLDIMRSPQVRKPGSEDVNDLAEHLARTSSENAEPFTLSRDQFTRTLLSMYNDLAQPRSVNSLFSSFDMDRTDRMDYRDLMVLVQVFRNSLTPGSEDSRIAAMLSTFDEGGRGVRMAHIPKLVACFAANDMETETLQSMARRVFFLTRSETFISAADCTNLIVGDRLLRDRMVALMQRRASELGVMTIAAPLIAAPTAAPAARSSPLAEETDSKDSMRAAASRQQRFTNIPPSQSRGLSPVRASPASSMGWSRGSAGLSSAGSSGILASSPQNRANKASRDKRMGPRSLLINTGGGSSRRLMRGESGGVDPLLSSTSSSPSHPGLTRGRSKRGHLNLVKGSSTRGFGPPTPVLSVSPVAEDAPDSSGSSRRLLNNGGRRGGGRSTRSDLLAAGGDGSVRIGGSPASGVRFS